MDSPGVQRDLELAFRLADLGTSLTLPRFRRPFRHWLKSDGSPVTEVDELVEDRLRDLVRAERPGDAFLGEERGETGRAARRWLVDAIDGTADFVVGSPNWGTLVALEVDGRVVCGVYEQPAHGNRCWAVRGQGSFRITAGSERKEQLTVSRAADLGSARAYVPDPDECRTDRARHLAGLLQASTRPQSPTGHPAVQVADGSRELAVFLSAGPWDLAATSIIVEEAGGRFTDLAGRASLTGGGGVFSNGRLHDDVLRVTGGILPLSRPP